MNHRILIIGSGSIGERHARCFQRLPGVEVGICEPGQALREKVAKAYGIREAFSSLDEALTSSWHSAVVATPASSHVPIAQRLIEAGIAPLIEKPLAVEVDGLDKLMATSEEAGVLVGVAYVYRAHPALAAMRDAILEGRFGKPLQVVVVCGQSFPFHRPAYASTYYADHARGGGAVQDALTHFINAVEWLVGPITRLVADAAHQSLPHVTVEDTVGVLARHGEVLSTFSLNQFQSANETSITVACESGTVRFEVKHHRWCCVTQPDGPWENYPTHFKDRDDWFVSQSQSWLNAAVGQTRPLCSLTDAAQTLLATRAILDSLKCNGAWQDVPTAWGPALNSKSSGSV